MFNWLFGNTNDDIPTQITLAESDMVVTLEDAHRAAPELSLADLVSTKDVREYISDVVADMKEVTGQDVRVLAQEGHDVNGEPFYIAHIVPDKK